ncbi:MAG TPA: DNRLRE domain-containing protein, partial [Mycobacterium sp.]
MSAAGSLATFEAATGSTYYFDAANTVLYLKAKPSSTTGSLVVSFGGSPDTEDPTAPTGLIATASAATRIDLSWTAATDNVGVTGYRIYRAAQLVGTVPAPGLTYQDTGLTPETSYTYRVSAIDAANNESPQSSPATATTPASAILTVPVVADAYVDSGAPTTNFGSSTKLRVDASPTVQSFLRFNVSGVSGTVTKATLRIFATSSQSSGYNAAGTSGSWTEGGVTYNTRPGLGSTVGSSGAAAANTWTEADVTPLVSGDGTIEIGIATGSSTALALSSREGGAATAPQLVLEIASGGSGTAPVNTVLPSTSGSTQVGGTRTATTGTWTGTQPISYAYQWLRCDASGGACADIGGATTSSYTIASADLDQTLRARVTATNSIGSAVADSGPSAVITQPSQGDPVLAVAGDIACDPADSSFNNGNGDPTNCQQMAVSDLMIARGVDAVIPLGDNQYECGGYQALLQSYDPSWGRLFDITFPVIGNHDYTAPTGTDCDPTGNAAGHWQYWGAKAGDPTEGYYSADVGTWHVVLLNSNCSKAGGCQEGSAQQQWLAADLAAHPNTCTIAAFHHPRWSSAEKPNDPRYDALWRTLADAGADVLVVGHAHQYQRFTPMDANGQAAADGLREFVVGTGGKHIHAGDFLPNENPTTLQTWNDNSFGALFLTLHPTSYDWEFAPIPGEPFTDSGSTNCSTGGGGPPPTDITPPSAPTNPRTTSVTSSAVDLAWDSSTDNVGVTGYTIYRTDDEGLTVFSVNGSTLAYQDATVTSGATYSYTIDAFDAAGNHSAESTAVVVTIPPGGPTSTLTFTPTADSYVDASKATTNYGTSSALRADAAPDVRSYLRFNVQVGTGTVTRATLRIFANSASSSGISARSVSGSWTESTINYNNRPAMGGTNIGSSGPAVTGTWLSMDVTPLVAGNGNIDIGVLTAGSTAISLASRESVNDPQLVVEFSTGGGGDAEPPTVPGGVTATTLSASSI